MQQMEVLWRQQWSILTNISNSFLLGCHGTEDFTVNTVITFSAAAFVLHAIHWLASACRLLNKCIKWTSNHCFIMISKTTTFAAILVYTPQITLDKSKPELRHGFGEEDKQGLVDLWGRNGFSHNFPWKASGQSQTKDLWSTGMQEPPLRQGLEEQTPFQNNAILSLCRITSILSFASVTWFKMKLGISSNHILIYLQIFPLHIHDECCPCSLSILARKMIRWEIIRLHSVWCFSCNRWIRISHPALNISM